MQLTMRWKDTRITELTAIHEFGKVHACARMISGERRGQDRRMTAIGFVDNPCRRVWQNYSAKINSCKNSLLNEALTRNEHHARVAMQSLQTHTHYEPNTLFISIFYDSPYTHCIACDR